LVDEEEDGTDRNEEDSGAPDKEVELSILQPSPSMRAENSNRGLISGRGSNAFNERFGSQRMNEVALEYF